MRAWTRAQRNAGRRIGLVPTMGYLHEGHLALVDEARRRTDAVVLSIFVNPLQFGPREDLARYPRDLPRDRSLAQSRGVDALFVPSVEMMYPSGSEVRVTPGETAERWEGAARPGHFTGVLTVVAKLFHLVQPDLACFGQKDIQQLTLIRRMVRDLDWPIELVAVTDGPRARRARTEQPERLPECGRSPAGPGPQPGAARGAPQLLRRRTRGSEAGRAHAPGARRRTRCADGVHCHRRAGTPQLRFQPRTAELLSPSLPGSAALV